MTHKLSHYIQTRRFIAAPKQQKEVNQPVEQTHLSVLQESQNGNGKQTIVAPEVKPEVRTVIQTDEKAVKWNRFLSGLLVFSGILFISAVSVGATELYHFYNDSLSTGMVNASFKRAGFTNMGEIIQAENVICSDKVNLPRACAFYVQSVHNSGMLSLR